MTFRTRLILGFALVGLGPLLILGLGVRREVTRRVTADFEMRLEGDADAVSAALARESRRIENQLAALARAIDDDNTLRRALRDPAGQDQQYLLGYAARAMALTGLSLLRLFDDAGRILSSGHFRGEFGRVTLPVVDSLRAYGHNLTLISTLRPTGESGLTILARIDSLVVAGRYYWIVGGRAVDGDALGQFVPEGERIALVVPGGDNPVEAADGSILTATIQVVRIQDVDGSPGRAESALFVLSADLSPLDALRRRIDIWFGFGLGATALIVLMLAWLLAARISRPLASLADKTARVDLTNLDVDFSSDRTDEVGQLADLLGDMMKRLRSSREQLTMAERRATVGDMSRQLNHDIKNGLTPLRNVVQHLSEIAASEPHSLARVFKERQQTLRSSISYLEELARNVADLAPGLTRRPCDLNAAIRDVARGSHDGVTVELALDDDLPMVLGDVVAIRRIFENLIGNAVDSMASGGGTVTVTSGTSVEPSGSTGWATVRDTGPGMTGESLDRVFTEWYTTKRGGTGLGLPIVRRLVLDLGGKLRVETAPGQGTAITVELPLAGTTGGRTP